MSFRKEVFKAEWKTHFFLKGTYLELVKLKLTLILLRPLKLSGQQSASTKRMVMMIALWD
jgi:hypothetical protein